jgi:predicted nucleic acid-binding protein
VNYIFDACALIAYLNDEKGADTVEDLLKQAENREIDIFMSVVNLVEVYYHSFRGKNHSETEEALALIDSLPIKIISEIDKIVALEAARFKLTCKMPLGDCFLCATASRFAAVIVSSDYHDLKQVEEKENIRVLWTRGEE